MRLFGTGSTSDSNFFAVVGNLSIVAEQECSLHKMCSSPMERRLDSERDLRFFFEICSTAETVRVYCFCCPASFCVSTQLCDHELPWMFSDRELM